MRASNKYNYGTKVTYFVNYVLGEVGPLEAVLGQVGPVGGPLSAHASLK